MKKENKTERITLRLSGKEKDMVNKLADDNGMNVSKLILSLIDKELNSVPHEQYITKSLEENKLINSLFSNGDLSNKSKQVISREIKKYVGN